MSKKYIILHHSASPDHPTLRDFDAIKKWHVNNNGWRNIGYHWVIERVNGKLTATPGRPEWDTGAHCIGRNGDGIGMCVVGNFEQETPSEELYKFVAQVCRAIMSRHPIQRIDGHRDHNATACPGRNFSVDKVRRLVQGQGGRDKSMDKTKVYIGNEVVEGKIIGNRVWVPVREFTNKLLQHQVVWNNEDKTVTIERY